jgi:hypothetical protein
MMDEAAKKMDDFLNDDLFCSRCGATQREWNRCDLEDCGFLETRAQRAMRVAQEQKSPSTAPRAGD